MLPADVGLYRTVTVVPWFAVRLYGLPDTILKGADTLALPDSVPPPVFCTVKVLFDVAPTWMDPKSSEDGVSEIAGGG